MKKIILCLSFISICAYSFAQKQTLPNIMVKNLNGESININTIENNGDPIVISFWATWCKPCKKELNAIAEVYEDWQDETGVKLIAISIDDRRNMHKIAPEVNSAEWEYEIYLDPNRDLARALGVSPVPHTFLLNGKKEIVWQHTGYAEGDEEELYEKIKEYQNKK